MPKIFSPAAAGEVQKALLLKRGMFGHSEENAAQARIYSWPAGKLDLYLCERGIRTLT